MKKLFTILCAVLVTFGLAAQTETGTMLVEGSSNFNYSSIKVSSIEVDGEELELDDVDASNTMGLRVIGAYFMMDGLAAGLLLDYSSSSEGDWSSSAMSIGPVVRYYVGESGMWAQLSYAMGSSSDKYDGETSDGPSTTDLRIGAGYAIMLADNVSLSPAIAYSMQKAKTDDDVEVIAKGGGIIFGAGLSIHLGN